MGDTGSGARDFWEGRYRSSQTGWDRGEVSPQAVAWTRSGALEPCRLLIPGSGRGHEALWFAAHGFDVTAIDIAPSAVAALKGALAQAGLSAHVLEADLMDWMADSPFDAIYEQTCLCAIDPGQREAYRDRIHAWLRPGGLLACLFMQTGKDGGPPWHCDMDDMRRLFSADRFVWPDEDLTTVPHPTGLHERGIVLMRR